MEVLRRVEPEVELDLPVSFPLGEHVRVEDVGLAGDVPEELEVDLVVGVPDRGHLQGR